MVVLVTKVLDRALTPNDAVLPQRGIFTVD